MTTKAEIFSKYLNSKPANIQTPARSLEQVHADFLLFVKNYTQVSPSNIDTSDVTGNTDALAFFKTAMSTLLHPVYGTFSEPMFGSGNYQLFKLRPDGGTYRLEFYGINSGRSTIELNDAKVTLSEKSVELTSNNGNSLKLERSGETVDVNKFVANASSLFIPVWKLTTFKNGSLSTRHYLVPLSM